MSLRVPAAVAGLLGGASWVARAFQDSEALRWAGLVLIGLALAAAGAGMVKAAWLGLVVGIAFPALVWSVLEVLHDSSDSTRNASIDALAGAAAVLVALAVLVRAASRRRDHRSRAGRTTGSHAR